MGLVRPPNEQAMKRHNDADKLLSGIEKELEFVLPVPWKEEALPKLLLNGMSDPELYLMFDTLIKVERMAGRIERKPKEFKLG